MTNRTITRRLSAIVAAPLVTAGIIASALAIGNPATAGAQPVSGGQCTAMTMPDGGAAQGASMMTRAGQIVAAAGVSASDGSMAVNCQPAGHS